MIIRIPRIISVALVAGGLVVLSLTGAGAALAGTAAPGEHPFVTEVFHAVGSSPQYVVNATESAAKGAGFSLSQCTGTLMEIAPSIGEWEATLTCTS